MAIRNSWAVPGTGRILGIDGEEVHFLTHPLPEGAKRVEMTCLRVAEYSLFAECAICLASNPATREHVPPDTMGGKVLTRTCERCNNAFGAMYEPHLVARADSALMRTAVSADGFQGHRNTGRMPLRMTEGVHPMVFMASDHDEVQETLEALEAITLVYERPDPDRVRIALLKSVYLAACVIHAEVPRGETWDEVRQELADARDAPSGVAKAGRHARRLRFWFQDARPNPQSAVFVVYPRAIPSPEFFLVLADRVIVSWPFGGVLNQRTDSGAVTYFPLSKRSPLWND